MCLDELMGRRALGSDRPEDYIAWAVECLAGGSSSENVAILAGLDLETPIDKQEVHKYFQKACRELGIEWPDKKVALRRYSEWLCRRLASGELDRAQAVSQLARLSPASGHLAPYRIWEELEEDLWLMEDGGGLALFNRGLTLENTDEFIRQVAAQYLQLLAIDLPQNFFHLAYCSGCQAIHEPVAQRIDAPWWSRVTSLFVRRRRPEYEMICHQCGSREIRYMYDFDARRAYLARSNSL